MVSTCCSASWPEFIVLLVVKRKSSPLAELGLVFISHPLWSAVLGQRLGRWPHAFKCILDVEAFAKAMQNSARSEQKEGDGEDKKDEEEDMSLD